MSPFFLHTHRLIETVISHYQNNESGDALKDAYVKIDMLQKIFNSSNEAIMITGIEGNIICVNQAFSNITGYIPVDIVGKNPRVMKSGKHDQNFYKDMWGGLIEKGQWQGEVWDRKKSGEIYLKWLTITSIKDYSQTKILYYIAIFSDISRSKKQEEEINFLLHKDPLTGLNNRFLFREILQQEIADLQKGMFLVLIVIDLKNFHYINDKFGHRIGDLCLKEVPSRLRSFLPKAHSISRISGDEFAIILSDLSDLNFLSLICESLIEKFNTPFLVENESLYIPISAGISVYPEDTRNLESLIANAETARLQAKHSPSQQSIVHFYSPGLNLKTYNRLSLELKLRKALQNGEFFLVYQPKISLRTGKICGWEALLRWNEPNEGIISPVYFIPLLEETGLIIQARQIVIDYVLRDLKTFFLPTNPEYSLAFNVSGIQFSRADFVEILLQKIQSSGINAEHLQIEFTESTLMEKTEENIKKIMMMKQAGLKVSIDDFGTGYSSFAYLKNLPIDNLKIDRSFIVDVPDKKDSSAIVRSIIDLAHNLNLTVTAEGIETEEQLRFLQDLHCDEFQGFYFSRPLPIQELESIINKFS